MITLGQACDELGIGYRTLEKFMRRLGITPARHPIDYRFYTLSHEQVEQLRDVLSQRPVTRDRERRSPT